MKEEAQGKKNIFFSTGNEYALVKRTGALAWGGWRGGDDDDANNNMYLPNIQLTYLV